MLIRLIIRLKHIQSHSAPPLRMEPL
jgi:hypothetical protein